MTTERTPQHEQSMVDDQTETTAWALARERLTVAIRRRLADLPVAKDIVVTSAKDLERGSRIAGTIADEASREGVDVYCDRDRNRQPRTD